MKKILILLLAISIMFFAGCGSGGCDCGGGSDDKFDQNLVGIWQFYTFDEDGNKRTGHVMQLNLDRSGREWSSESGVLSEEYFLLTWYVRNGTLCLEYEDGMLYCRPYNINQNGDLWFNDWFMRIENLPN